MAENTLRDALLQVLQGQLPDVADAVLGLLERLEKGESAKQVEEEFRDQVHRFGARTLELALGHKEDGDVRQAVRLQGHLGPDGQPCQGTLASKGRHETTILTMMGPIHPWQWTAVCRTCGRHLGALHELMQVVNGMSAAAASVVGLEAVKQAYEPSQMSLKETQGLAVDDNRVAHLVDELGPTATAVMTEIPRPSHRNMPPRGSTVYVLTDGGRIRTREKGCPWREPCLGLVTWQRPDGTWVKYGVSHPTDKAKVLGVLDKWMLRLSPREEDGWKTHWDVVIIADGAEWIWNWAGQYWWATKALDYYHLKETVWKAAKALYGEGTAKAAQWVRRIMDRLWCGWVPSTVQMLHKMKPRGWDREAKWQAVDSLATYLENHADLMRYGENRNAGRRIGSGAIESLCKQVFSMRMKGPGMFWGDEGALNLMALRTLYVTGRWDSLWEQPARKRAG